MDEQESRRAHNVSADDPDLLVRTGRTRDVHVQEARASGNAGVYQAGRDQYIETHLYFGVGVHRTRRVEPGSATEADPYPKGMAAFGPEDAEWFFGRDRLLADLIRRVDERFREGGGPLMVMAPSGAGKSSLLHAGLIPKLEQGAIPGSQHWPGLRITPTARPIKALAEAIAVITGEPAADVERTIAERPDRCVEALGAVVRSRSSSAIAAGARLIVIVDQLEELFTLCTDDQEQRRFLDLLSRLCTAGAADGEPVALVVLGMRADFYARCAEYPELRESVQHGHVVVGPMTRDELREAILHPAQRAGLSVEPGLVELLLRDLGAMAGDGDEGYRPGGYEAGRLPLLAHALRATYLGRHGRSLSVEAYRLTGGIENAVATTADHAFDRLDPAARDAARVLFLQLIKIGDGTEHTRRRVPRTELLGAGTGQTVTAALDAFTGKRLLTQGLDRDTVEITHEALIHAWPRLRDWINEDRAGNLIRQQLTEAATAWENEGRDRSALYRGARLQTAREHASTRPHSDNLTATTRRFLRASAHNESRAARRRNTVIVALSLLSVLSLFAAYVANSQREVATANQLTAQADQILKDSLNGADLSLAAQLNLAAYQLNKGDETIKTKLYDTANDLLSAPPIPQEGADSVAFSPDGRTLASGGGSDERGLVQLWDASVPEKAKPLGEPLTVQGKSVSSVAFSADGRTLASGSGDSNGNGLVQLWDVSVPEKAEPLSEPLTVQGEFVSSVAFSADGRTLASGGGHVENSSITSSSVRLWDVSIPEKAEPLGEPLTFQGESLYSVAFSADGRTLASGGGNGWDGLVRLWDVSVPEKAEPLGEPLTAQGATVNSVALSSDGRTLASASASSSDSDGSVRLWDVSVPEKAEPLGNPLTSRDEAGFSVAFSKDGRMLASGGGLNGGGSVRLWDVSIPEKAEPLGDPLGVQGESVTSVAFSANGQTLASASSSTGSGSVRLLDVPDRPLANDNYVRSVTFSEDGRTLASGGGSIISSSVQLWDVSVPENAEPLGEPLTIPGESVSSVALSKDGQTLASGGGSIIGTRNGSVRLWDVSVPENAEPLGEPLTFPGESVSSVAFSKDGRMLASGGVGSNGDGFVRLWDVSVPAKAEPLGEPLTTPGEPVSSVALSEDGRTLAGGGGRSESGDGNGFVRLWDVSVPAKAEPLGDLLTAPGEPVSSVAFSADGRTLASGSSVIDGAGFARLWDVSVPAKAEPLGEPLTTPAEPVSSVAFSADGQTLASSGGLNGGGFVRLWDVSAPEKAEPLGDLLTAQRKPVESVAFSADGRTLASDTATAARLHNINIDQVIDRICKTTGSYLTPALWDRHFSGREIIESPCPDS
ncbi:AAA family ATPase [Saccharopolyspora indica]|uniref:NACHT and WD repeat domain-containing protein n=1 Tax=Saccharopolyspora indica TaxID=1229659 RepID=UPI0022EB4180|nr:AAA family ATPase [Saccharopolyspora indica]MDA3647956.1 AAA family ATPase [Saccharopolyspora indica]